MSVYRIATNEFPAARNASVASYLAAANEKPLLRFTPVLIFGAILKAMIG